MTVKLSTNTLIVMCIVLGIIIGPTVTYYLATTFNIGWEPPSPEQGYICDHCGQSFSSLEALENHIEAVHGEAPSGDQMVSVTRHLDWQVIDDLAGGGIASVYIYVYDTELHKFEGDGSAYKTGTDGTLESGIAYTSGDQLKVELVNSNAKAWYSLTVPKMNKQDAETLTYNPVILRFYGVIGVTTAPSFTLIHQGTSIADAGDYNCTTSGTTRTFTWSIHCNDDNTGYIESYDPLNEINWWCVVYLKQFTGNYADISLTGWDGSYEKGSAMYYYKHVTATGTSGISKYKVGNTYVWTGSWSFSFAGDFTGLSGDTTDWDINVYIHSDPAYYEAKSSFGPDAVQLGSTFDVDIFD